MGSVVLLPKLRSTGLIVGASGLSCPVACEIFLDQGPNLCPLHWQVDSSPLSHQGSPTEIINVLFSMATGKKIEHKSWNSFQKLNFGQLFCSWCSCCELFLPPPYHPAEEMLGKDGENISLLLPLLEWSASSWRDGSGSFDTVKGVVSLVDFANWCKKFFSFWWQIKGFL